MPIRFLAHLLALLLPMEMLPASPDVDLSTNTTAQIVLMDYVNTEHQPIGYTYRGTVTGNITIENITIGNKTVVPDKAKVLMRLVSDPGTAGALTIEWWAVKFGDEWSEFRSGSEATGLFTILKNVKDMRTPQPDAAPLIVHSDQVRIPFGSVLRFEIRRPVRLVNVGRTRL